MNHTVSKIPPFWNDERVALLTRLWNGEGRSASYIARMIPGSTRSGVIGKAHRLGLQARPSPIPVKTKLPALFSVHTCQWPHGDPKEDGFHFCGARAEPGRPYCGKHCKVAYRRVGSNAGWTDDRKEQHRAVMLRWHERRRLERHP